MFHVRKNYSLRLFCFFIVFIFAACNKKEKEDDPGNGSGNSETKKGFHTSTERPVGNPFVLPAGVSVADKIKGYSEFATEYCDNKTENDAGGVGALVKVCLPFYNNNNSPVSLVLPPGLIFIARQVKGEKDSTRIQNGILVQQVTIIIPAKTLYFQPVYLCCLNDDRSGSAPAYEYEMGPVTIDKDMNDLFAILNKKKLSKDPVLTAAVQGAVWDVTAGKPIGKGNLDIINAQPDR